MDSKKKYEQMVEDGDIVPTYARELYELSKLPPPMPRPKGVEKDKYINYVARDNGLYIYLLDFNDGEVYRYDISVLGNEGNGWNPDNEACEAFLYGCGHSTKDCEWMVTTNDKVIKR